MKVPWQVKSSSFPVGNHAALTRTHGYPPANGKGINRNQSDWIPVLRLAAFSSRSEQAYRGMTKLANAPASFLALSYIAAAR
jgi:hypothetical protein